MRNRLLSFAILACTAPAMAGICANPSKIEYEPQVVELSGRVYVARARHPNGTVMKYPIMKLPRPVSIQADGVNSINSAESCVREVQLVPVDDSLRKKLYGAQGKTVIARGAVFHEHTAWHMRKLLVTVTEAKIEP